MDTKIAYGLAGIFLGGIVVWLFLGTTVPMRNQGMMRPDTASQNQMGTMTQIDAHFIEQMIPHHEDAITMAKMALEKAQHPEVRQLAQAIIDSQSAEIRDMKAWYKEWFGREVPTGDQVMRQHGMMGGSGMHMGRMGNETDMARLEKAADFDRAFIEEMIPHHQMAVMMASMLKRGTNRAEMRELADAIITAQTNEIDQMRQWYTAWFSDSAR